jgi:hypothetical protein
LLIWLYLAISGPSNAGAMASLNLDEHTLRMLVWEHCCVAWPGGCLKAKWWWLGDSILIILSLYCCLQNLGSADKGALFKSFTVHSVSCSFRASSSAFMPMPTARAKPGWFLMTASHQTWWLCFKYVPYIWTWYEHVHPNKMSHILWNVQWISNEYSMLLAISYEICKYPAQHPTFNGECGSHKLPLTGKLSGASTSTMVIPHQPAPINPT